MHILLTCLYKIDMKPSDYQHFFEKKTIYNRIIQFVNIISLLGQFLLMTHTWNVTWPDKWTVTCPKRKVCKWFMWAVGKSIAYYASLKVCTVLAPGAHARGRLIKPPEENKRTDFQSVHPALFTIACLTVEWSTSLSAACTAPIRKANWTSGPKTKEQIFNLGIILLKFFLHVYVE